MKASVSQTGVVFPVVEGMSIFWNLLSLASLGALFPHVTNILASPIHITVSWEHPAPDPREGIY